MRFDGKIAVVTGGGGGIGRAACVGFARAGAKVVVVDIDEALGRETAELIADAGGEALFVPADVSQSRDVQNYVAVTVARYGRIDCFFNNAGLYGEVAPTQRYDEEMFDRVIAVNLKGVFLGLRHVMPVMLRQGGGAIVNTASISGLFGPPARPDYVASKHGIIGLTKVASTDGAPYGVRCNAISPGMVDTRMMRIAESNRNADDPESVAKAFRGVIPTGRYSTPEEIAHIVLFLCSDLTQNVSGMNFVADGGTTAAGLGALRRDPDAENL